MNSSPSRGLCRVRPGEGGEGQGAGPRPEAGQLADMQHPRSIPVASLPPSKESQAGVTGLSLMGPHPMRVFLVFGFNTSPLICGRTEAPSDPQPEKPATAELLLAARMANELAAGTPGHTAPGRPGMSCWHVLSSGRGLGGQAGGSQGCHCSQVSGAGAEFGFGDYLQRLRDCDKGTTLS